MFSFLTAAFAGAALVSGVLSAPAVNVDSYKSSVSFTASSAEPTGFLLSDDPSDAQLRIIEELAHGTLPNGPPPPPGSISDDGITNLQFIEFNENFERAFFASLIVNITENVPGFEIKDSEERNFVLEVLIAVLAQEDLHALNAKKALQSQNQTPILPCKYKFPSNSFEEAIEFAATFTDVVLGTLQDVIEIFANNNDNAQTRGVASVVGQEGEQEGFYRILQNKNKIPNELPFLTTSTRDFAFSALEQGVIVSCPNDDILKKKLKIFGVLNLLTKNIEPKDQNLQFSFDLKTLNASNIIDSGSYNSGSSSSSSYKSYTSTSTSSAASYKPTDTYHGPGHVKRYDSSSWSAYGQTYNSKYDWTQLRLVYINQQNSPIVEKLQNVKIEGTVITFEAFFPFEENLLNGLTLASVTFGADSFANANAVAAKSVFAPALIEVN